MSAGVLASPVAVIALFYALAFPWHFLAIVAALVAGFVILVIAHMPSMPDPDPLPRRRDIDRAATDLLSPPQ